jgi:putative ATPase
MRGSILTVLYTGWPECLQEEKSAIYARRMVILASEDKGCKPKCSSLANTCFEAFKDRMPEAGLSLSTAIYLATSPKSNSAYMAIDKAYEEIRKSGDLPVPLHLRNAPTN